MRMCTCTRWHALEAVAQTHVSEPSVNAELEFTRIDGASYNLVHKHSSIMVLTHSGGEKNPADAIKIAAYRNLKENLFI